nr:uncharacterized protein C6orf226 homolog [Myripristis murdjan]
MEAVFMRFDSYNFKADERFQTGLVSLERSEIGSDEAKVLDMKLFFYNRFVEPIDSAGYKQWHFGSSGVRLDCSVASSDCSISTKTEDTCADTAAPQLSFEEVMRLVQAGEEVPGVTKLDIQPSNQDPTPSQMERRPKPWETSVSQ